MSKVGNTFHIGKTGTLACFAGFLSMLVASPCAFAQQAPEVTVANPVVKEIVEFDEFIGRFDAVDQVDIRARVSGYVDKIAFTDGATVKAGDLLFKIDPRPYQAALDEAKASLEAAKARLDFAVGDLARAESLRRTGNIAGQVFDERSQALATAKADVNRAQATLNRTTLELAFTDIRAPISGRLSRRLVSIGNLVNANDTILTNIVSMDPINFYFDVDERSYLSSLRNFDPTHSKAAATEVSVALTEGDRARRGTIDFLDNRLDQASGTMRGRVSMRNEDLSLVPGLFGRVRLPVTQSYEAVLIPDEAVRADQDRRLVFVVEAENKLALRPVQLGGRAEGYRIVRAGLTGEETIVVNGLSRAQPGIQIQPKLVELPTTRLVSSK